MKSHKILIVDDETSTLNIIVDCFEELESDYTFYQANNGKDGLRIALEFKPDLIITDWEMPVMDGIEMIKRMKKNELICQTPIVMLTGRMTSSDHLQMAFNAGAIDFIRKPIDKIELIARVRSMLMLADSFRETIDLKDRDLTNTAIHIVQNNEFNVKLRNKVMEIDSKYGSLDSEMSQMLVELKEEIADKLKGEAWNQFDMYFKKVHPDFFNRIVALCPSISSAELRLAGFLRLNIATKDIAAIMFLTVDSVRTARTRLRKKLSMSQDDNLIGFLMAI
jgi:DNA-binding response OmpR family regulator/DNA-binding CsgD family transcriptional regulator